jgi:flavodoxin
MKKIISVILAMVMMCVFTLIGCAAEEAEINENGTMKIVLQIGNPVMLVNGIEKQIDAEGTVPLIINNRTLLPVRAVIEEMGGTVEWNSDTQEVVLNYNDDEIKLTIDSQTARLNGQNQTLDTPPIIISDRTMLPIRFVAESFKFDVVWEKSTQTITIMKKTEQNTASVPSTAPRLEENKGGALTLYFSATGTTKALAEKIADVSGADLCEIVPQDAYTSADLNYNSDCRANAEQQDDSARPAIKDLAVNINDYDIIILGYPIWWGTLPKVIYTLSEKYDLSGKIIMPFCTSGGSGISESVSDLKAIYPNSTITDGFRGAGAVSEMQINDWLNDNGFEQKNTEKSDMLKIRVGGRTLTATLADNSSATALKELLSKGDITIDMSDYGDFEKVGLIGTSLPLNDEQITTEAGDLILYQGNSFVICYDTNFWNFTRLGKINDIAKSELKSLLGEGDVTVTISIN